MMKVKLALWMLSVLLFWTAWPAGAPSALANGPATGTNGCVDGTWAATSLVDAPSARVGPRAVWTGMEMLVWGGYNGSVLLNTGGRYNPATDAWTAINTDDAPSARNLHTAVWTGSEMLVWGGYNGSVPLNTGGRYDPATDTWTATNTTNAPSPRSDHTAVWTGTEMLVWGGQDVSGWINTGSRYNPATNTWTAITTVGAPSGRRDHTVVWTGTEMLVWGGYSSSPPQPPYITNTGGRYDPATDTWTAINTDDAPSARINHTAVWTDTEMLIWGGYTVVDGRAIYHNTGGRYDPESDTWTAINTVGTPSARGLHTAVWTGSEMLVWGGFGCFPCMYFNTGGRYDPATDTWTATSLVNAPSARAYYTVVWTGTEMIIWGGSNPSTGDLFNTGGHYCASADRERRRRS